ncbi:hypothetical protein GK091_21980 [Spirosoma agri]|uniref:Glycosyltransferase RgtA/B/C/D-like domain-containing protein n=2 Tax=Spirosoma agri TaxID=1987381 RepID=A0A6M0IMM5_9BACT|nr:hypothetical protein [Spirosoma agri]
MGQQKKQIIVLSVTLMILLSGSIIASLFFKESWLWMDEVLSYLLVSDPSVAHLNDAVVSGMDANPPLFVNLYWFIGHTISMNPQFLRAVSVVIFAGTIALFYRNTSTLIGKPITNFVFITLIVAFTYLNLTLSTQIRGYSLFLLISLGYFMVLHRLMQSPSQTKWLIGFVLLGILLVFTHNFGLFYAASSGAFVAGLLLWSKNRKYWWVLGAHGLIALIWLLVWYPSFAIQTEAGKPHSWIPLPTFLSFFATVGELAPTVSSTLERRIPVISILRFLLIAGLWLYIALPRLRAGYEQVIHDRAFTFYVLSGFLYIVPILIALAVTLVHTSVFISRYLWPGHLLLIYQLLYAFYFFAPRLPARVRQFTLSVKLLPVYMALLAVFMFYQNRKTAIFPSGVLSYLPQLDKQYPVFVETADYFLPIWFHHQTPQIRYLLDWKTASQEGNILNATVHHKILKSVREKYGVGNILPSQGFNRTSVPHFYVIDESSNYQIEHFIENGQVRVVRQLPINIEGHRILECVFQS